MVVKKGNGAVSGSNSGPSRTMVIKKGKGAVSGSNSGPNRPMVVKKGKGAVSGSNSGPSRTMVVKKGKCAVAGSNSGPNRTMVLKKGKGAVSGSNSGPNSNDAVNTPQNETIVSSPLMMNAKESGLSPQNEDKEENLSKEVMNEENEILGKKRGRIAIEEEDNKETVTDEQEQHEENGMEEEKINELTAIEVKGNEQNITDKEEKEEKREENIVEQAKNEKDLGANSQGKVKLSRKRRRTKKVIQGGSEIVAPKAEDKPGSSSKKVSKRAESMGMIFMCSSKTKQDCYRYKVFGLPSSKKDIVEKVYKGMRLFLFDFDLRLMYGIYKAAGPGGYNIEPKAFKSAFPSQVRFSVLEDCSPLAEDKFKMIIKDNYYAKNKFDCQLTSKQVKDLCKLFVASSRGSKSAERSGRNLGAETRRISKSERLRRNVRAETHTYLDREQIRQKSQGNDRHFALVVDQRYRNRPIMYERESFASALVPVSRLPPLPAPPALTPSYASYGRTLEMDVYRQDPLVEHLDRRLLDLVPRHQDEIISRDFSFSSIEPLYCRDPLHSAGLLPEHNSPPGLRPEYRHLAALPSEYSHPAGPPSEYGSLRSFYRY